MQGSKDKCFRIKHEGVMYHAFYLRRFDKATVRNNGMTMVLPYGHPAHFDTLAEAMEFIQQHIAPPLRTGPKRRKRIIHI